MKWKILTVGRPALDYARRGTDEYLLRLRRQADVEWLPLRDLPKEKPGGTAWLVLDERGAQLTTEEFRRKVDAWEHRGSLKQVQVLIGGADGHDDATRHQADCLLALGRMTLQHELALVVFLEQLYRVHTLKRGEPYHRP